MPPWPSWAGTSRWSPRWNPWSPAWSRRLKSFRKKGINAEERLTFAQQLSEMLEGGMSMQASFDLIIREAEPGPFQALAIDIAARLRSGIPLSEALMEHKDQFDRFFTGLVRAGESSGQLPLMLTRLSRYMERTENVKRQVRASLMYPLVVLSFAFCLDTLVSVFGVPRMAGFYEQLGAQLPLFTRVFMAVCSFLFHWVWIWVPLVLVGAWLFARWIRSEMGGIVIEKLILASPLRVLLRNVVTARFTRTLGTLYGSGVPLTECLSLVGSSVGSRSLEKGLRAARERVQNGEELAVSLKKVPMLSPMVIGNGGRRPGDRGSRQHAQPPGRPLRVQGRGRAALPSQRDGARDGHLRRPPHRLHPAGSGPALHQPRVHRVDGAPARLDPRGKEGHGQEHLVPPSPVCPRQPDGKTRHVRSPDLRSRQHAEGCLSAEVANP